MLSSSKAFCYISHTLCRKNNWQKKGFHINIHFTTAQRYEVSTYIVFVIPINRVIKLGTSRSQLSHTTLPERRQSLKRFTGNGRCERLFISTCYIIFICNINWLCFHRFSFQLWDGGSSVSIVTRLRVGHWFPAEVVNYSHRRRFHTGTGAHPASYSTDIGGLFPQRCNSRSVKLITLLHLVLKSRMCGALPLLSHTSSRRGA
jgi:hypothetical protein